MKALIVAGVLGPLTWVAMAPEADARDEQEITVEELGRLLFWDPILSGAQDVACGTCHHPDFAYADGRALSLGTGAVGLGPSRRDPTGDVPVVRRNSPTVLNVGYNGVERRRRRGGGDDVVTPAALASVNAARAPMFWDSRVRSLEAQALEPIKAFDEMRGDAYPERMAVDSVIARLRAIPEYVSLFESAFGTGTTIGPAQLGAAIAAFERSLVAMNSPLDRYRAGDRNALTEQQRRGMEEFDDAGCDRCHEGPMFSDFDHHAEGVAENPLVALPDTGRGRFRFRTPSLRNIALTAPYMHNGTLATLEDVLEFYDEGRSRNPNVADRGPQGREDDDDDNRQARLSGQFRRVDDMSEQEREDIVAFLEALSDPAFDRVVPAGVPSGLTPGGRMGPDTR
jgi:cytochrome c peroxidase